MPETKWMLKCTVYSVGPHDRGIPSPHEATVEPLSATNHDAAMQEGHERWEAFLASERYAQFSYSKPPENPRVVSETPLLIDS